jgi:NAD(P)-dependent dehydrogenase (short-subunit alcohol dehydrogenase family)
MLNKVVCISGVSKGLGYALAKEFDRRSWNVAGCARSEGALIDLGNDLQNKHLIQKADITQQSDVQTFANNVLSTLGVPSLMLNNAGKINKNARLHEISSDEFLDVLQVNLLGTHNMIRAFLPSMLEAGKGTIVNFSSYWGQSTAPEVAPYCASKWAIEGLTRALAQELPFGLSAVALNPGVIDTDMLRSCFGESAGNHEKPQVWARHAVDRLERLTVSDSGTTVLA